MLGRLTSRLAPGRHQPLPNHLAGSAACIHGAGGTSLDEDELRLAAHSPWQRKLDTIKWAGRELSPGLTHNVADFLNLQSQVEVPSNVACRGRSVRVAPEHAAE